MTVAQERQYLSVQLTPMILSESLLAPIDINDNYQPGTIIPVDTQVTNKQLVIYPGEPSEMLISLDNDSRKYCYVNIKIKTNLPQEYYHLSIEDTVINAADKVHISLICNIPQDFFESEEMWELGKTINLDYLAEINISYCYQDAPIVNTPDSSEITHLRTEEFEIYIRPRSLYLNFLPDIYREVDFIGRLLSIFERTFEPTVEILDSLHLYLDPRTAPSAILPFLAHWVGWQFLDIKQLPFQKLNVPRIKFWLLLLSYDCLAAIVFLEDFRNPNKQRDLIYRALQIYSWRGTKRGLREYLHFCTGLPNNEDYIAIQDVFAEGFQIGKTYLGQTSVVGGGKPFHFVVRLYPEDANNIDEKLVRKVIEQEKPAFCSYELYIKEKPNSG